MGFNLGGTDLKVVGHGE